nr:putative aminotransferase [Quercus suber]
MAERNASAIDGQETRGKSEQMETPSTDAPVSSLFHGGLNDKTCAIVAAQGHYLETSDGRKIFDASGGAAVACLGHNNARVKKAISDQLDSVAYCYSPFFTTPAAEKLAEALTRSTHGQMSKAFITGSGAEAVEAAMKMARQYFMESADGETQRVNFIGRRQAYHGNTIASLSVGDNLLRSVFYKPMLTTNVSHVSPCYPYRGMKNDETDEQYVARLADELEAEFQRLGPDTVCAFIAETVSGGSVFACPPTPGYFKAMKDVCDRHGALLILDEVLCGMGRTGSMHAWEQEGIVPHLQTVAKGLGAGYQPVSALLVHRTVVDRVMNGTKVFLHSQTYQTHPVACAAAYEVQKVIQDEGLVLNVQEMGEYLGAQLKARLGTHKHIGDIRGRGLWWGMEFVTDKTSKEPFPLEKLVAVTIHRTAMQPEFGISLYPVVGIADGSIGDFISLSPPYNITRSDIDLIVERTGRAVEHVLGPIVSLPDNEEITNPQRGTLPCARRVWMAAGTHSGFMSLWARHLGIYISRYSEFVLGLFSHDSDHDLINAIGGPRPEVFYWYRKLTWLELARPCDGDLYKQTNSTVSGFMNASMRI